MTIPVAWFDLAWVAWLLSELVGAVIVPVLRRGPVRERQRSDRGSGLAILVGVFLSLGVVSTFRAAGFATLPLIFGYVGVALVVVGIAVRQWAIAVLGPYFSTAVRVLDDHRVVSSGPYRYVRHPSYSGALLTLLGLGLVGGSWQGTLVIAAAAFIVFGYRIHVEERLLREQLGAPYVAYQSTTKRLIPFVF